MDPEMHTVSLEVPRAGEEVRVRVSALLTRPGAAEFLLVMAHGAGAGMRHPGMESMVAALGRAGIAVFRYQFPYMERGGGPPDPQPALKGTVRAAVEAAVELAGDLPVFAGGRSMGGRMTSLAATDQPLESVRGIIFFGFPLHPAGKPVADRAQHLSKVTVPLLFVQGSRDALGEPDLIREVCAGLANRATLHVADAADHSFHVLKRSGRTETEVLDEVCDAAVRWMRSVLA